MHHLFFSWRVKHSNCNSIQVQTRPNNWSNYQYYARDTHKTYVWTYQLIFAVPSLQFHWWHNLKDFHLTLLAAKLFTASLFFETEQMWKVLINVLPKALMNLCSWPKKSVFTLIPQFNQDLKLCLSVCLLFCFCFFNISMQAPANSTTCECWLHIVLNFWCHLPLRLNMFVVVFHWMRRQQSLQCQLFSTHYYYF